MMALFMFTKLAYKTSRFIRVKIWEWISLNVKSGSETDKLDEANRNDLQVTNMGLLLTVHNN
jgi:hypothetical protein